MIPTRCSLIFGEFRLISEGVGSVPAVYKILGLGYDLMLPDA